MNEQLRSDFEKFNARAKLLEEDVERLKESILSREEEMRKDRERFFKEHGVGHDTPLFLHRVKVPREHFDKPGAPYMQVVSTGVITAMTAQNPPPISQFVSVDPDAEFAQGTIMGCRYHNDGRETDENRLFVVRWDTGATTVVPPHTLAWYASIESP